MGCSNRFKSSVVFRELCAPSPLVHSRRPMWMWSIQTDAPRTRSVLPAELVTRLDSNGNDARDHGSGGSRALARSLDSRNVGYRDAYCTRVSKPPPHLPHPPQPETLRVSPSTTYMPFGSRPCCTKKNKTDHVKTQLVSRTVALYG